MKGLRRFSLFYTCDLANKFIMSYFLGREVGMISGGQEFPFLAQLEKGVFFYREL